MSRLGRLDRGDLVVAGAWAGARLLFALSYLTAELVVDRLGVANPVPLDQGLLAWDGAIYVDIARLGYETTAADAVRFFPLLPLLVDGFALFGVPAAAAGVAVVNLATLAAGLLTVRIVRGHGRPAGVATLAGVLVVAGPVSFATVLAYTEGLYLLLTAVIWWALDRDRPVEAALAGVLVGLCRPVGVLLAIVVVIEVLRRRNERSVLRWAPAALAPLAGFGSFLAWTSVAFDDWLAPFDRQTGLRGDATNPVRVVADHFSDLLGDDTLGDGLHLVTVLALIVLAAVAVRVLPLGWAVFSVLNVAIFLTAPNLNSIERYGGTTLPLIVAAAVLAGRAVRSPEVRLAVTASASGAVSSLLTVLLLTGAYVP